MLTGFEDILFKLLEFLFEDKVLLSFKIVLFECVGFELEVILHDLYQRVYFYFGDEGEWVYFVEEGLVYFNEGIASAEIDLI